MGPSGTFKSSRIRSLAPMLAHLSALGRNLAADMTQHRFNINQKTRSWSQHRSRQPPRCLSHPIQLPQNVQKPLKTSAFAIFFNIQHICQNAPKMFPKFNQGLLNWAQHGHLDANMAHLGRNLLPTWLILGSCCAHLRPNFSTQNWP